MFPESYDDPSRAFEKTICLLVSRYIRFYFHGPITTTCARQAAVTAASMPETTIHENCHSLHWKDKVRFALEGEFAPPANNPSLSKKTDHAQFG
jgi:hypothetical protein